jgi:hypothetical protein
VSNNNGLLREEQLARVAKPLRTDERDPNPLIGVVVDLDERSSDYGPDYTVVTVEQEETGDAYDWHAFHKVARDLVARKQPQIGDMVGIMDAGVSTKTPKKGQSPARIWKFRIFERGAYGEAIEQAQQAAAVQAAAVVTPAQVATATQEAVAAAVPAQPASGLPSPPQTRDLAVVLYQALRDHRWPSTVQNEDFIFWSGCMDQLMYLIHRTGYWNSPEDNYEMDELRDAAAALYQNLVEAGWEESTLVGDPGEICF